MTSSRGSSPDPGMEPESLVFPALAGGFFTTSATWEAHKNVGRIHKNLWEHVHYGDFLSGGIYFLSFVYIYLNYFALDEYFKISLMHLGLNNYGRRFMELYRRQGSKPSPKKQMQKGKMVI